MRPETFDLAERSEREETLPSRDEILKLFGVRLEEREPDPPPQPPPPPDIS
jgi:hypothetical protein